MAIPVSAVNKVYKEFKVNKEKKATKVIRSHMPILPTHSLPR